MLTGLIKTEQGKYLSDEFIKSFQVCHDRHLGWQVVAVCNECDYWVLKSHLESEEIAQDWLDGLMVQYEVVND